MHVRPLQFLVAIVIILLVINLILLAMGKISEIFFWITIAIVAVFAYVVIPRLKKKLE